MFNTLNELLDYIKSNNASVSVSYDLSSKNLIVINNSTDQVLFNQDLNYQIGEFRVAIEPLFTSLGCSVDYVNEMF